MLADHKRAVKQGLSQRMKDDAKVKQCPQCHRRAALKSKSDGVWLTVWCRYCDYETGSWLSNTGLQPDTANQCPDCGEWYHWHLPGCVGLASRAAKA